MIKVWLKHLIFEHGIRTIFGPLIKEFNPTDQSQSQEEINQIIDDCIYSGFLPREVHTYRFIFERIIVFDIRYGTGALCIECERHMFDGVSKNTASVNISRDTVIKIVI
jgi:hypothetical protein